MSNNAPAAIKKPRRPPSKPLTLSTRPSAVLSRAKRKELAGEKLSYSERRCLEQARARRTSAAEAHEKRAHAKLLRDEHDGPHFAVTKFGRRVIIPNDHPGGPWSAKDELEVVARNGRCVWITLHKLHFIGGDPRSSEYWSYMLGRQSRVVVHVEQRRQETPAEVEHKAAELALEDDDLDRVETGAGAAYLNARRKKSHQTVTP